jgi:hypothetical protein
LALVTDVDIATARNLVDSMTNEVVVRDDSIKEVVPGDNMSYDDAVRLALADRAEAEAKAKAEKVSAKQAENTPEVEDSSSK